MSCNDDQKQKSLLDHLKHHTQKNCSDCQVPMTLEPGALPFGKALMTTWICPQCRGEDVIVVREDGEILEVGN